MNSTKFEESPIFEKLDYFRELLLSDSAKEKIDTDNLNFYNSGVEFISDRLKITIPSIVNEADLNSIITELVSCIGQINNYLGNNNIGHLNNASNHLFASITRARNLPIPLSKSDFNFSKAITNFEKISLEKLNNLTIQKDEHLKQLKLLKIELAANKKEVDLLNSLLSQKEIEIQNLNSSFQTEFSNIKNIANQNYQQDLKTFRSEFNSDKESYKTEISNLKSTIDTDTTEIVDTLKKKLVDAEKIVDVIGNVGATGNFQKIANSHFTAANIWRIIAIAFMTILSVLLIYTIWEMSSGVFDWTKSLIRIIAAAALSYPATYAAQESSKHRKQENYNRRIELELASINPFIELLDENKKKEIKAKLVDKYFGNNHLNEISEKKGEVDIPISAFERIIKTIGNLTNK